MINRSVREWEYLQIGEGAKMIPRRAADQLIAVARRAQLSMRMTGANGQTILTDYGTALRAGQVVGVVAAPGISLEILPKIDGLDDGATRINLVRMLAKTLNLTIAGGALAKLGHQEFDLLEILIRMFCEKLFVTVHRGLPRRYLTRQDDLPVMRGRLNLVRQFTTLAASPQRLACSYEELSVDIPLNQILKSAVQRLRRITRARENQRRLIELEFAFDRVTAPHLSVLPWEHVILDRTNQDWHDLFHLAQLLLGDRFQTTSFGEDRGFSLVFEMNTLFEEFVGSTLKVALQAMNLHVTLQGPRSFALSEMDEATPRFMTKPDIVIHQAGSPVMIIDTKWKRLRGSIDDPKRGVSQADVYQMMAYGQVYGVKRLLLLYPHHNDLSAVGPQSTHIIKRTSDSLLRAATVDLSHLETAPEQLKSLCCDYLGLAVPRCA